MYIQRYLPHLPAGREVVIFDRSWYNRAGVERVMGFCTEDQTKRFLGVVPNVEKEIVNSAVNSPQILARGEPEEQTNRLKERIDDGRKIWKLSTMDIKSYTRWDDYSKVRDDMFLATDTAWAPWHGARSDDKRRARLNISQPPLEQDHLQERAAREGEAAEAASGCCQQTGRPPIQARPRTELEGCSTMRAADTTERLRNLGLAVIAFGVVVAGLVVGRSLLIPLAIAILLWSLLEAMIRGSRG